VPLEIGGRDHKMSPRRTTPIGGRWRDAALLQRRRSRLGSVLALGLKSTYRREMHLAFCLSRQVIEVANIFSALRAHHRRKPLIRNMFSRFSTPALLLSADVTTPFRTNLHCLMACLGPELTPVVSHLHLNQRPAKENHDLLTRGQWRSLANKSAGSYSDPSPLRGLPSSPSNDLWV